MCTLPRLVRWTFKGLWEVCADDSGRFLADARVIKGQLWPLDDDISAKKIETYLTQLEACGRIRLYVVARVRYGVVVNFLRHQKISHPTPSKLPDPPEMPNDDFGNGSRISPESPKGDGGSDSGNPPETLQRDSRAIPERFRPDLERDVDFDLERSGSGSGGGFRKSAAAAPSRSREKNGPIDRRLPPAALDLLAKMPAARRPDGEQQLWDALEHSDGAKIRRGVYARAQSPAHLEHACRHVLKQLPRDPGLSVLWVLNKLLEPWVETDAQGRTVTEAAAYNGKLERAADERDRRQRLADAEEWVAAHPDEWAELEARETSRYPNHENDPIQAWALRMALTSAKIEAAEAACAPVTAAAGHGPTSEDRTT
jgi:hypothetical protein